MYNNFITKENLDSYIKGYKIFKKIMKDKTICCKNIMLNELKDAILSKYDQLGIKDKIEFNKKDILRNISIYKSLLYKSNHLSDKEKIDATKEMNS